MSIASPRGKRVDILVLTFLFAGISFGTQRESLTCAENSPLGQILHGVVPASGSPDFLSDVFGFFALRDQYNTDLKRAVFAKTQEYKTLLDSMNSVRVRAMATKWYVVAREQGDMFEGPWELYPYDVRAGGFYLRLGRNFLARVPKSCQDFHLTVLPTERRPDPELSSSYGITEECILLPMGEQAGLAVETNWKTIKVYVLFTIAGMEEVHFRYYDLTNGWCSGSQRVVATRNVRIVVGNASDGAVYFDKSY
jgi:hypothetical protein